MGLLKGSKWGKWLLIIFILVLPFLVFYWQVPFLSDWTIGNDYIDCAIHEQLELQYSLKQGSFPLYVPGFAGGQTSSALTMGQMYHPISHLSAKLPGYWQGKALHWNTLWRLLSLGLAHLALYILLCRIGLSGIFSFIISFITVYNFRMLDLFRHGAALENYTGYLFLCAALAFYYIKPTRFTGPVSIIASTYLLVCGGHPQMMYLGLIGAGIAAVAIPFILGKVSPNLKADKTRPIKYFKAIGVSLAAGILLASAYTLPFYFDFLRTNALRIGHDYQWSLLFSDSIGGTLNSLFAPLYSDTHGGFGSSPLIILIALVPFLYLARTKVPAAVMALWTVLVLFFLCLPGEATPLHYLFWKYFPLAQSFRVPGRIALVFPFLFLLMLAWLFRGTGVTGNTRPTDEKVKLPFLPLVALPLFILYNWVLVKYLPTPGPYTPARIQPHPPWVDPLLLGLGIFTLVLVALHALYLKQISKSSRLLHPIHGQPDDVLSRASSQKLVFFANLYRAFIGRWSRSSWRTGVGILLAVIVVAQVTVEIRFGTWMVKHPRMITADNMEKQKKRELTSYTTACYGLESTIVVDQMRQSILEPGLAKFYRKYKKASNQEEVYRFLNKENVSDTLIVEGAEGILTEGAPTKNGEDAILLEESSYNRVLFSVNARAPGFFTFSSPYSGNWSAKINGKSARLYRANGHMHAVYVENGQHQIEFRYWSKAAFAGMLISCLTFLFTGIYFAFFVFGKKRKQQVLILIISLSVPVGIFGVWYAGLYSGDNLGTQYTWASGDFPPVDNLAYAKKTKMSPGGQSFQASRGVDGRTRRPPFKTPPHKKGWWQVDLGTLKQINEIVIYDSNRGHKHLPLQILGSTNGKTFKPLKNVKQRGKDYPWRIAVNGEITRFVRIQSPARLPMAFNEVEIYPTPEDNKISGINGAKGTNGTPGGDITPQKIINMLMHRKIKSPGDREINVWNQKGHTVREISPALIPISRWGKHEIDTIEDNGIDSIRVRILEPGKEGIRRLHLGYEFNRGGLNMEMPGGKYIHFIVKAAISPGLLNKDNFIVVQDFEQRWKSSRAYFISPGYKTYLISKKVRPGSQRLILMIKFTPQSSTDRILIREVRIFVSEKEL